VFHSSWLPVNVPRCQIHCDNLVPRTSCRTEDAQRRPPNERAIVLLTIGQRRHGLVDHNVLAIRSGGIPIVGPQDVHRSAELVTSRQRPISAGLNTQAFWLIQKSRHFGRPVLPRIKDRGNERRIVLPLALQDLRLAQEEAVEVDVAEHLR
jgi:hypothetical protein